MVESVVRDKKRILPCAAWLTGQYGIEGVYAGVPVKLGRRGVEEILELELEPAEREALKESTDHVRETMRRLGDEF